MDEMENVERYSFVGWPLKMQRERDKEDTEIPITRA